MAELDPWFTKDKVNLFLVTLCSWLLLESTPHQPQETWRHIAVDMALICDACRFCSHFLSPPGIAPGKNQAIILELDVMVPAQYIPFLTRCRKQSDMYIFVASPSPFSMRFFYNIMHHINTISILVWQHTKEPSLPEMTILPPLISQFQNMTCSYYFLKV